MKIIAIGGDPASGKTTLMRAWMESTSPMWMEVKQKALTVMVSGPYRVLGEYRDGETFAGTDRLSMAVQPVAVKYVREEAERGEAKIILFEGDRLFTKSFLKTLTEIDGVELSVLGLYTGKKTLEKRHHQRGDTQNETWLRGRATKNEAVIKEYASTVLPHDEPTDTLAAVKIINKLMGRR